MLRAAVAKQVLSKRPKCPSTILQQVRHWHPPDESQPRRPRRRHTVKPPMLNEGRLKSEWWIVDGEIHEIGDNVPNRERFVIPRDNLPNRRRKQLRHQFMARTRLVIKDNEHEPFCKKYMELYNELRENWERLYWDDGYSEKLAVAHKHYDSPEEDDDGDDEDFSPYRRRGPDSRQLQEQGSAHSGRTETLDKVSQIRDKFEYDREMRLRETAFAPMIPSIASDERRSTFENPSFDEEKDPSGDEDD